jgi:hypothetical protein
MNKPKKRTKKRGPATPKGMHYPGDMMRVLCTMRLVSKDKIEALNEEKKTEAYRLKTLDAAIRILEKKGHTQEVG